MHTQPAELANSRDIISALSQTSAANTNAGSADHAANAFISTSPRLSFSRLTKSAAVRKAMNDDRVAAVRSSSASPVLKRALVPMEDVNRRYGAASPTVLVRRDSCL